MDSFKRYDLLCSIFGEKYPVRSGQFKIDCFNPECDDTTGNLEVSLDLGVFHCWKCDYKGSLKRLLKDFLGWSPNEDEYVSADNLKKFDLESEFKRSGVKNLLGFPKEYMYLADDGLSAVGKKALNYVLSRISLEDIKTYKIGYCGLGVYKWRIIVPFFVGSKIVYFIARSFFNEIPKYKNPTRSEVLVGKEEVVFNIDGAHKEGVAVICEGVFDAIKVGCSGVAILGTSLSDIQASLLLGSVKKIYVMLDADALNKAVKVAKKLLFLSPTLFVSLVKLPHDDPASFSTPDLEKFILNSKRFDFLEELGCRF